MEQDLKAIRKNQISVIEKSICQVFGNNTEMINWDSNFTQNYYLTKNISLFIESSIFKKYFISQGVLKISQSANMLNSEMISNYIEDIRKYNHFRLGSFLIDIYGKIIEFYRRTKAINKNKTTDYFKVMAHIFECYTRDRCASLEIKLQSYEFKAEYSRLHNNPLECTVSDYRNFIDKLMG